VACTGKISVGVRAEQALAVLWDIQNLKLYEPKADSAQVEPETKTNGIYTVQGRFAGMRWRGKFSYEINDRGFHSELVKGPSGVRVNGGFVVQAEDSHRCQITHYENYQLPYWMSPLVLLFRLYLFFAMKKELRDLAAIIQAKNKTSV
jgi:hypothetical protein